MGILSSAVVFVTAVDDVVMARGPPIVVFMATADDVVTY